MENILTSSNNPRLQNQEVTGLFLLDRMHTSFVELFALSKDFVAKKDVEEKFLDFYAGGVGTTMLQLMAGHSEYDAYEAIMSRRESYLFEAQQRSSGVGISAALGYSAYRGKNIQLLLTFTPNGDFKIEPYQIVGGVGEYDIISLEEKSFQYGYQDTLLVVIGKLMEEDLVVPSAKTHFFRFKSERVSEHIQISINGAVVEYSKDIVELLQDKYVTLSNPVGGIDVFYLNRFPPNRWASMTRYTFYDYITPDYSFRLAYTYAVGDHVTAAGDTGSLPVFYECIRGGVAGVGEPTWNSEYGETTVSGETLWRCIGSLGSPRYFRSATPGIAESGNHEPIWPIALNDRVQEGEISWIATNVYGSSKYPYSTGDKLNLTYVELEDIAYDEKNLLLDIGDINVVSLEGKYQPQESLDSMRINAPLYHETKHLIRGREDYRKLFSELTTSIVDANIFDVSPAVVQLSYVKDHSTKLWEPDMLIDKGVVIMPSSPNGFLYKAISGGRSGLSNYGATGVVEPVWNLDIGDITYDGQVLWETVAENASIEGTNWMPKKTIRLNDYLRVTVPRAVMFRATKLATEPLWPNSIGATITDNAVVWRCDDTIHLSGYNASYYEPSKRYYEGDYVKPVTPTGYFYVCRVGGYSDTIEPNWPTAVCETVVDGGVIWECYDLLAAPVYVKNIVMEELPKYRPFGVEPNTLKDPVMVHVSIAIDLVLSAIKDIQTIKSDVDEILGGYSRILGMEVHASDLENAIEGSLSYVHIARVSILGNSKLVTWEEGAKKKKGDVVVPTVPDGFFYKCQLVIDGSSNYTAWSDRGYSSMSEPVWPTVAGEQVIEDSLVWEMVDRASFTSAPLIWNANTIYIKDTVVAPTAKDTPLFAKLVSINFSEPAWPGIPGKAVRDNKVYWVCINPNEQLVPLAWDEYYVFGRNITISSR